jgi:hypothetical protein
MHWSKLLLLKELMATGGYDWYVWVDDDIYFTDLSTSLEEKLAPYPFDDIALSEDSIAGGWCSFNTGRPTHSPPPRVCFTHKKCQAFWW